jgi:hypothetical protein
LRGAEQRSNPTITNALDCFPSEFSIVKVNQCDALRSEANPAALEELGTWNGKFTSNIFAYLRD